MAGPRPGDLLGRARGGTPFSLPRRRFAYVGSGKAAIASILAYLRETGVLADKMDGVLVPGWLGVQVYQTILDQGQGGQTRAVRHVPIGRSGGAEGPVPENPPTHRWAAAGPLAV